LNKQQFHKNTHFYLSLVIAFFLPLARLLPILIALLVLNWLVEGDFKNKFKRICSSKLILLFCLFYLLHVAGLLYTENMKAGNFDVQVKLSLLIFPVLYGSRPLQREQVKPVFLSFITGTLVCSFILLTRAISTFLVTGENNFFYESFSAYLIHPSYLAMYMNVAICWILIQIHKNETVIGRFSRLIFLCILLYFSFLLVLLSSKMGLLTLGLICLTTLIYYSRKKYLIGIAGLALCGIIGLAIIKFVPALADRIKNAREAITAPAINNADAESTAVRMLIWKAANQVITENFVLGTGTGDSKDALMHEYEKRGMTGAIEHRLNAHNEFYQVFVSIGLIGFLVLCMQLLIPLIASLKENNWIYVSFLLIILLNFLTESMLEAEAGVIFYAFFNSIFCSSFLIKQLISPNDTIFPSSH
jgi:O-antigen ligase